jgi:2-amino-4-hydroxy-6-hydroxymethyldihydropteridine diphosphokinase
VTRAVLSIGSNLGDRVAHLNQAVATVRAAGAVVTAVSPVYQTPPWPPGLPGEDYLNAVLLAQDPDRDAPGWLALAHAAEQAAGRVRLERWGPRTLDVDVVQVDGVRSDDLALTLPHPRAHERAFVLEPWAAVDPAAVLAGQGPVAVLLAGLPAQARTDVRRRNDITLDQEVTAE